MAVYNLHSNLVTGGSQVEKVLAFHQGSTGTPEYSSSQN